MRRTRRALAVLAVVVPVAFGAVPPTARAAGVERHPLPADGVFHLVGAGWGHGRGMSQWGAQRAATQGRTHREILGFYYPGTTLGAGPVRTVRVLIAGDTGRTLVVRAVSRLRVTYRTPTGTVTRTLPRTPSACPVRATRWRAYATSTGMRLDAYCGRWRTVVKPARLARGSTISFSVPGSLVATQDGTVRRGYRGSVIATRLSATRVRVVNRLSMEQYLRVVTAAEVPASWPTEALRAQAVAARSYATYEIATRSGGFDVYDSTRSQAYPGARGYDSRWRVTSVREHPRTDRAVADTAGVVVLAGGSPALTQFGSSNGGATADTILPYMTARADAWDAAATGNPRRTWTDTVTARSLAARHPAVGTVTALEVLDREGVGSWGGRVARLRIVGTRGSVTLATDSAIRATLGTYSSYFTIRG